MTTSIAYQDSLTLGLGVEEYEPNGRAADEVRRALNWILERIRGAAL
jgi:chromosome partitioning protein